MAQARALVLPTAERMRRAGRRPTPGRGISMWLGAFGAAFGFACFTIHAAAMFTFAGSALILFAVLAGAVSVWATQGADHEGRWGHLIDLASLGAAVLTMPLFVVAMNPVAISSYWVGSLVGRRMSRPGGVPPLGAPSAGVVIGAVTAVLVWAVPNVAGAWSVDESSTPVTEPRRGNGVVTAVDTHAFLLRQGVRVLEADGHTEVARFLTSADPTAPLRVGADGRIMDVREPYLWRLQTGARDADRSLKQVAMPDHFFNWWTHSGKGLIAGPSAATWAEQQFLRAVRLWHARRFSAAMYRLGAAAHLVADGCAPPHASALLPNHRRYEEWVLSRQQRWAIPAGGIYATQFRHETGHGGPEWSSAHTRGWVDECAHRAAPLTVNAAQPPPDGVGVGSGYASTRNHFGDAQRLTAGYLVFFFDTVEGEPTT